MSIEVKDILAFLLRPRRKTLIGLLVLIWIAILFTLFLPKRESFIPETYDFDTAIEQEYNELQKQTTKAQKLTKETILKNEDLKLYWNYKNVNDQRGIDAHSSIYDHIFAEHEVNSILQYTLFSDRCDLYFTRLYIDNPGWKIDPDMDCPLESKDEFRYKDYRRDSKKVKAVKEEMAKEKNVQVEDIKEDQEFEKRIKLKYSQFWAKNMEIEQKVVDALSHLRIFNKCYVTRDDKAVSNQIEDFTKSQNNLFKDLNKNKRIMGFVPTNKERLFRTEGHTCAGLESRVYPWLSRVYPTFERWNGEVLHVLPDMKKYLKDAPQFVHTPSNKEAHDGKSKGKKIKSKLTGDNDDCFIHKYKNEANGKGIVLSIGDKHMDEAIRLIRLLRALNNRYPIQIVYNDGLTEGNKLKLKKAAREAYSSLPLSFQKVKHLFPPDYLDVKQKGLPQQEIWFVNVNSAINVHYKNKFGGFSNKFLATMFNSFEEYILVDADTILVQNPHFYFSLKEFVETGTLFYKDRAAPLFRPISDGVFFKKISPSLIDQAIFDIPIITKKSIDIDFFQGLYYYMESGLVILNRNLHFNSILMMIQMNFYQPVSKRVYGDKEIFWLAFVVTGEENYHFNKYFAAAIGEETPMADRVSNAKPQLLKSKEICAAHPAHIGGEDGKTLHWFNSGFRFCGQSEKVNYGKEFGTQKRYKWLKSEDEMKSFYSNPIRIKQAVVPPFKNKFETYCENVDNEPSRSWHMDSEYCNSYLWCGYSSIGGMTDHGIDNTQEGLFIEFDSQISDLFDYYGDIWVDNE